MNNQEKALKLIQEIHDIMKENNVNIEKAVEIYLDNEDKRYCTVTESLEQSLKEMQLMRQGKLPKKTWREYMEESNNE